MKKLLSTTLCMIALGSCSILATAIEESRIDISYWDGYYMLDVDSDSALSDWEIFITHYKIADNFFIEQQITYDNLTGEPIIAGGDVYHVKEVISNDHHSLQVLIINSTVSLESEYLFSMTYDEASTTDSANTDGYYYTRVAPPMLITLETTDKDMQTYIENNSSRYRRSGVSPVLVDLVPAPNFDPDGDLTPFLQKVSGGKEYQFWELTASAASVITEYGSLTSGIGMGRGSRVKLYQNPVTDSSGKVISNNSQPVYGYAYKDSDSIDSPSYPMNYTPGPNFGSHKYGVYWFTYTAGFITTYYGLPVMIVNDIVFTGQVSWGFKSSDKDISDDWWDYFDERGMTNLFKNNQGMTKIDDPTQK